MKLPTKLLLTCAAALALAAATPLALAAEPRIIVGVNQSNPPFILPESESGLQVDIIRAAFASQSVPVEFKFLPPLRVALAFKTGFIDVVTTAKPASDFGGVYSRWPIMTFHNQAISLSNKHLKLRTVADLSALRVIAFHGASKDLGADFAQMTLHNPNYAELPRTPSNMLTMNRTDVVIAQPDIFRYNLSSTAALAPDTAVLEQFDYQELFSRDNQYWFGFRNERQRDLFERGLATIYASGEIDKLFSQYQQRYGTSRTMFISLDCQFLQHNRPAACPQRAQD